MKKKFDLNVYEEDSRARILELIDEYADGSRALFAEKTGISKGSISQYCNGKNTPSNVSAEKIADALGVNPVWVMGFDVPKYTTTKKFDLSELLEREYSQDISYKIRQLSSQRREMLLSYLDYLINDQEKEMLKNIHFDYEETKNEKNN